ncbi:C2 domain in Dock180 and Zizimin proteins-domain-containing protein [Mycena floridula]|nr:C2 domain in Dock180 and Zizimin proteins-domain-containing protein [Mycena floridula]
MWEPLPFIVYGYAVHPLTPSRRDTRFSNRNRPLSSVTEVSTDEHYVYRDVVSLEVGDEVYAFEKYTPTLAREVDGVWYRGYVVCTTRRPSVNWALSGDQSLMKSSSKTEEPQQVFIGIFPASHIHPRDQLSDAEYRLPLANGSSGSSLHGGSSVASFDPGYYRSTGMDTLKEEDEDRDFDTLASASRKSFRLGPPPDQASFARAGLPVYSASLRSSSPAESRLMKPLPPRPSLKSGDDTISGAIQPIIDEIASALREWHTLMFQYLARRDYKLFQLVREHIEALHLGRRQLLAQTLSAEETINMRRDCVTRLVSGNLVQGLDVIVRHPSWGALVTVNVEGEIDSRSWVSAVRMYAMQCALAYLNVDFNGSSPRPYSVDYLATSLSLPTPAHSAFSDLSFTGNKIQGRSGCLDPQASLKSTSAKFYHIFLDLRAFVASPCSPGETAELFFSLYKKQGIQFITEDFCVVLNHHGVLARNPSSRIRTLFTDLALADVQDPVYLVCRIVRNGAMKIGGQSNNNNSTNEVKRASETSSREAGGAFGWSESGPTSPQATGRTSTNGETSPQFRRPFGCAVVELTQIAKMIADNSGSTSLREHQMPIFVPSSEISFSMIHQNIISNNFKEFEKSSRADSMAVSIKVFRGDLETVVRENTSLLQGTPHTLRLGFPDVVFPGDVRNELYVKLWSGEFASTHGNGGRLSTVAGFTRGQMGPPGNNVQVTIEVRDSDGKTVESVISQGSGEPPLTQFNSMVFQKCNEPTFGELVKIQLPATGIPQWHLFFTFRTRRTTNRSATETSDRPFAFSFLPLFPDKRAFVEDGSHTLLLFKADKLGQITPDMYMTSPPWLSAGQKPEQVVVHPDLLRFAPPIRDTLTIRSSLCSTRFTQNAVLLSLLNWEKISDRELLSTVLTKFTFVGEGEIVKFLRDIFDSLFGILVSQNNQAGEIDHLVFNALVTVLGIVQDRRFSNFQPVLEVYIEHHFNCAPASSHMLHSMNRLVSNPTSGDTASHLRAAFKVWHYIIRFIARARELQKVKEVGIGGGATAEHLESTFKRELRSHLSEVTRLMTMSSPPAIIGTQTIALQHFTAILPELAKTFSTVDLVSIVTTFATNAVTVGKGKIVIWKLIMYLQIVKGFLFDNSESRPLLVEAVVLWIKPHFGRYDEYAHTQTNDTDVTRDAARLSWLESIRLCVTIIAVMLDKLQQNLVSPAILEDKRALRQEQDNVEILLSLIPRLMESYREYQNPVSQKLMESTLSQSAPRTAPVTFPESYPFPLLCYLPEGPKSQHIAHQQETVFNPGLGEISIVFLVLILSSPTKHILNFLESSLDIEGRERFVNLLRQFFDVATSILDNESFPRTWLNVNILAHKVIIRMMEPVATILEKEFIPTDETHSPFDPSLWKEAFFMLLKLLSSEQLVIEDFSPQKRRAVWRLAGDIRGEGASIMLTLWLALGWTQFFQNYQVYLSSLIGPVVNLCLSHHEQLRNNAVHILYTMIISEHQQSGHFEDIKHELVTRLDSLFMSDSKGDDLSGSFFVGQLRHLFDTSEVDDQLREQIAEFLDSVDLFLELLLSVRALPEGEEFADERVIATLRLMNFIRQIGRDEIYIKYVHQLVNMHLQSQNYVEAALTLKLHADLHKWDLNSFLPPMEDLGLPQQSQFHRKETLCLLILDYLGKGKAWESAIEICKDLAYQHAEVTYNYGRLSEILRHQATLLEHIVTDQRYYSDYYLVTFYGNFPGAIRDKRFIYRGYEWEKFGAFCERMLNKHPGAQLLKTMGDPPVDIRFGTDQYIQCTAVTPEPNRDLPIFTSPDVPLAVKTYYEHSSIDLFSASRQLRKAGRDHTEEIWLEKTYFKTEETFPTVLRRSQVVGLDVVEISPIDNALTEVESRTKELNALSVRYQALAKTSQSVSTNNLSMSLNGAVDAPINTGISAYRVLFFSPDYVARNPERVDQVEKLRTAIDEQVRVIDSCLKLHGALCPPEFVPFHETLEKFFRKNFREEIQRLGLDGGVSDISPSVRAANLPSVYEQSISRSMSSSSTRRAPFIIPPLQLGRSGTTSASISPLSPNPGETPTTSKQTPLQKHLAHLARHGFNGVSSAPGDAGGSDSLSAESPHNSFVNVGNGIHSTPAAQASGASVTTSHLGSLGSLTSLKGRFSRFGSLNFGRRGAAGSQS